MGLFMGINYTFNIIIATCTLTIISALGTGEDKDDHEKNGIAKLFGIFSIITGLALLYICTSVAETKHLSLDKVGHKKDVEQQELLAAE